MSQHSPSQVGPQLHHQATGKSFKSYFSPFNGQDRESRKSIKKQTSNASSSQMDIYQNKPVSKISPTSQTGEQTAFNATMTSEWKSKLSPRGRGRI